MERKRTSKTGGRTDLDPNRLPIVLLCIVHMCHTIVVYTYVRIITQSVVIAWHNKENTSAKQDNKTNWIEEQKKKERRNKRGRNRKHWSNDIAPYWLTISITRKYTPDDIYCFERTLWNVIYFQINIYTYTIYLFRFVFCFASLPNVLPIVFAFQWYGFCVETLVSVFVQIKRTVLCQ